MCGTSGYRKWERPPSAGRESLAAVRVALSADELARIEERVTPAAVAEVG
jgi:hypothetical protein